MVPASLTARETGASFSKDKCVLLSLDRRLVRRRFEERFSASRMAADYSKLYHRLARSAARIDSIAEDTFVPPLEHAKPGNTAS
jgi:hypothetical protein